MRSNPRSFPLSLPAARSADTSADSTTGQVHIRRFPPVLQFLTEPGETVERDLRAVCLRAFRGRKSIEQICAAVYHRALTLGFTATIGLQEVYSTSMPSFSGETVWSVLLLIDMQPALELGTA